MNILLTNDDGYSYLGINKLRKVLEKYGTVYMVAPRTIQSGKGCAVTNYLGCKYEKVDEYTYIIDGTPVDCVCFAQSVLNNIKFDLVVSGCNDGWNLAHDTMYSGTCGACIQAGLTKLKAIAFSCKGNLYYDQIDKYTDEVLKFIFDNDLLSKKYFLNVNFNDPEVEYKGIRITKLLRSYSEYYPILLEDNIFKAGRNKFFDSKNDLDVDVVACNNGYISITPLGFSTFNNDNYKKVKKGLHK